MIGAVVLIVFAAWRRTAAYFILRRTIIVGAPMAPSYTGTHARNRRVNQTRPGRDSGRNIPDGP